MRKIRMITLMVACSTAIALSAHWPLVNAIDAVTLGCRVVCARIAALR